MDQRSTTEADLSKTIVKAISILNSFTDEKPEWGVRALAKHLDLSVTIVYRILKTLSEYNFLSKDPERKKYRLGSEVIRLASAYSKNNPLQMISSEVFRKYIKEWPYDMYMGTLSGYEVVYSSIVSGTSRVRIVVHPGERIPLFSTALGKVLLAFQDEEFIDHYLKNVILTKYTPTTLTDPEDLKKQLQEIREKGYSVNEGELYEQIASKGAPIFDRRNKIIGATCLSYPVLENDSALENKDNILSLLLLITKEINEQYLHILNKNLTEKW